MDPKTDDNQKSRTLRLNLNKQPEGLAAIENLKKLAAKVQEEALAPSPSPAKKQQHDFKAIYKDLKSKFPGIIDKKAPALLAVGVKQQLIDATGLSGSIVQQWIAWYFRGANYYALHKEGAQRFNLDGSEAGTVTSEQVQNLTALIQGKKKEK